jgi:hypothetical protein
MLAPIGVLLHWDNMQRRIALFQLLLALAGTLVPVALAATAASPHTCCIRATHHCHDSAMMSDQLALRDASCCNHDCRRAATTAQWPHSQSQQTTISAPQIDARVAEPHLRLAITELSASQSPRGPPLITIA